MSADTPAMAYGQFKAAFTAAVDRYAAMKDTDALRAADDLIGQSGIAIVSSQTIGSALSQLAGEGSIEACALMMRLGSPSDNVATLLQRALVRYPDAIDGCKIETLAAMFTEWADGEVAAGRMVRTICAKTGATLYGEVKPDAE